MLPEVGSECLAGGGLCLSRLARFSIFRERALLAARELLGRPSSRAEILMHAALIGYEGSENLAACFHLMRTRRHDRAHRLAARGRVPRRMDGVAAAVDQDGLDSCCGGQGSSGSSLSLSCSWVVVDKGGLCCGRSGLARNLAPAKVMSGEAGESRIVRDMASVAGCGGWERDGSGSEQLECADRAAGGGDGTGAA